MTRCEDSSQICELYDWIDAWRKLKHISAGEAAERIQLNLEDALQDYRDDHSEEDE